MIDDQFKPADLSDPVTSYQGDTDEIKALNEKLTLANEELKITNDELSAYKSQLEQLVSIRTFELQKKEEFLKYKNSLEKLIAVLSNRFFNLSPELVNESIESSLGEVCVFIHADAAFLAEVKQTGNTYSIKHSWQNEKISLNPEYHDQSNLLGTTWWQERAEKSDHFYIRCAADLPEESTFRTYFLQSGIKSMVIIPIMFRDVLIGFTGFCSSNADHFWNTDEISLIRTVGEMFVNAIKRKAFEERLIERERNYREIFNATNEAIFIYDASTARIIDVNQAALRLFGLTYEEALKDPVRNYSHAEPGYTRRQLLKYVRQAIQKGSVDFEWQNRKKSGEIFWTEVSMKNTEIGGDMRILAVVRDISERKKNQELVVQSEERFRSIIQYLTDIIWIIDENAVITYESPSSWQVLGYAPGHLIGTNGFQIIHPEDIPVVTRDLKEVFDKKNDYIPTEFRARHASGKWLSLEVIANNMLEHPAIGGIILTGRDVTERNRVEKAFRISESKFRNIFNNSSDAIVIVNSTYTFLEVNDVFLKSTGYTLEETRHMKITEIIADSYLPKLAEKLVKIFRNQHQSALECEIVGKSKLTFPAEINSKLIEYEGDLAVIAVIRNITERRILEYKILDTIISTEEKEREKFARNLHDELGPLLSSIKMYVNSLASSTEKAKNDFIIVQLKKILTEVIQSTKELSNDLSPHVLANYGLLAALEWFINQLKPHISINFESNLKDKRYPSSLELSMYRIIKELINNTLKHAQASMITIKLHHILKSVHLVYSDNGIGFKENWQDSVDTMGMGMFNIISRSRLINASSKFYNNAPHGMSFEMQIPVE